MGKFLAILVTIWSLVPRFFLLLSYIPAAFGYYEPALQTGIYVLMLDEKATKLWDGDNANLGNPTP